MKKSFINNVRLEGLVYEHNLEEKVSGPNSAHPGTAYITGTISIATDGKCLNIVPVHYSYVVPLTGKGTSNPTYNTLKDIIDGKIGTVMKDGKDKAEYVRVDTSIGLNEFYTNRNGEDELVSAKRNEGGFIHKEIPNPNENQRNYFDCDMLITKTTRLEANDDKGIPERVIVKGAIFDYRKALLPVEFTVYRTDGMDYFENLEVSAIAPVFTKVSGVQISETTVKKIETPSAFGDPVVREMTSTRKEYVINSAIGEPYLWDDASTITASELKDMLATRETTLAAMKKRRDDAKATAANVAPASGGFNF